MSERRIRLKKCTQEVITMTIQELEQCISKYDKDIYSFCMHLTLNKEKAEDLYQDTFLEAMKKIRVIEYEKNPKSYLLSIALRLWKNQTRKAAWRNRILPQTGQEDAMEQYGTWEEDVAVKILWEDEKRILWKAIHKLPDQFRIPILLYYMEECSLQEISKILSIPQGTVKSRLYHGRKHLEKELEEYFL